MNYLKENNTAMPVKFAKALIVGTGALIVSVIYIVFVCLLSIKVSIYPSPSRPCPCQPRSN